MSQKAANYNAKKPKWVFAYNEMVGMTGFEPAASASRTQRSTKLSHIPAQVIVCNLTGFVNKRAGDWGGNMMCLRRGPVYGAVKNRLPRRLLSFLTIVFVLFLLLKTFLLLESNLQPTILALAQARAKLIATEAINLAINQNIARDCRYDNLIFTQKDVAGNIVVAEVNNMELARIQTQTTLSVQSALEGIEKEKIKIPLGQVLNSKLLANLGPKIPVTLVPIGTVSAKMQQTFDSAGINVISHQVGIDITATIQIVIPFLKGEVSVNTYTPIVTATFFGRVPETVINLPLPNDFQFPSISGDE